MYVYDDEELGGEWTESSCLFWCAGEREARDVMCVMCVMCDVCDVREESGGMDVDVDVVVVGRV